MLPQRSHMSRGGDDTDFNMVVSVGVGILQLSFYWLVLHLFSVALGEISHDFPLDLARWRFGHLINELHQLVSRRTHFEPQYTYLYTAV